jgi:hypothetical protein
VVGGKPSGENPSACNEDINRARSDLLWSCEHWVNAAQGSLQGDVVTGLPADGFTKISVQVPQSLQLSGSPACGTHGATQKPSCGWSQQLLTAGILTQNAPTPKNAQSEDFVQKFVPQLGLTPQWFAPSTERMHRQSASLLGFPLPLQTLWTPHVTVASEHSGVGGRWQLATSDDAAVTIASCAVRTTMVRRFTSLAKVTVAVSKARPPTRSSDRENPSFQ